MKFKSTITSIAVRYENESPLYGDSVISVHLDDECGGFFLRLESIEEGLKEGQIRVEIEQLAEILKQGKMMLGKANK